MVDCGHDGAPTAVIPPEGLQILALLARLVGGWYLFNGAVALNVWRRSMAGRRPANRIEHVRAWTILAVANLTLLGGLLLLFLSPLAPYFFLACCAVQGAYFAWARKALPPQDEAGRRARRATFGGFLIYIGVTLFTLLARDLGLLA